MIAAYGDQVVMEETLARALSALFGESAAAPPYLETPAGGMHAAPEEPDRAREALGHYNRAVEKLKAGDWSGLAPNSTICARFSKASVDGATTVRHGPIKALRSNETWARE